MPDGRSQVVARLDAHNRGGREYTREAMERDLRSLEEQLEAMRTALQDIADTDVYSNPGTEFVVQRAQKALASNPALEPSDA